MKEFLKRLIPYTLHLLIETLFKFVHGDQLAHLCPRHLDKCVVMYSTLMHVWHNKRNWSSTSTSVLLQNTHQIQKLCKKGGDIKSPCATYKKQKCNTHKCPWATGFSPAAGRMMKLPGERSQIPPSFGCSTAVWENWTVSGGQVQGSVVPQSGDLGFAVLESTQSGFAEARSGCASSSRSSPTVVPAPAWHLPVLLFPPPSLLSSVPPRSPFAPWDAVNLTQHPRGP